MTIDRDAFPSDSRTSGDEFPNRGRIRGSSPTAAKSGVPSPNVLQVCKYYYPVVGGIQNIVHSLITGIDEADFRVLTSRSGGIGTVDEDDGTRVSRVGSFGEIKSTPLSLTFPYRLHRHLSWADLVHYHLPFPLGPISHLLTRSDETPIVVTFHDDIIGKGPIVYPYEPILDRFLRAARSIIVTSPNMRDACPRISKFQRKARVIPIGIEADDQRVVPRRPANERLLFVGRLVRFKGVRHLISAMKGIDASLSIVGKGPERGPLERHAASEGVSDRVTFEGFVPEERLDRLYRDASVFVLPSVGENESFGIVQLEAMQHGLPVINTALPTGVPFVSVDGRTGITVPPGAPEEIADAAMTLLENPGLYERYSKNAQRRVLERFSRDGMLDETLQTYRDALSAAGSMENG